MVAVPVVAAGQRPVWAVWAGDSLAFAVGRGTRTAANLGVHPRAGAHLESPDEVVVLEGTARAITDVSEYAELAARFAAKYGAGTDHGQAFDRIAYRLRPDTASAWTLAGFPADLTRWRFGAMPDQPIG